MEQPDYAIVFALMETNRVFGIWRYKNGPRSINLGLPAGYILPGESPLKAARRELFEETGYKADTWKHLGSFVVDGNRGCGNAHIVLARRLRAVAESRPDDLEEIHIEFITLRDLRRYLRNGTVATLGAGAAIALGLVHLTNGYLGK